MSKMKFYKDFLNCNNENEVIDEFIRTLKPSILLWDYFVNWEKVINNVKDVEIALNTLNYLIGKEDFDKEFKYLITKHPEVISSIPILIVRDGKLSKKYKILVDYKNYKLKYEEFDFTIKNPTVSEINKMLEFVDKTGLKNLIESKKIKNLVDYAIGVEAGLDSNGRKNRSGKCMETIVEYFVADVCKKNNLKYLSQANASKVEREFGVKFPVPNPKRIYDFVIQNKKQLTIIETNYYSGGGTKLKSVAGEFSKIYESNNDLYKFIWITDGLGWKTATTPLKDAFKVIDYLINLHMVENDILKKLINNSI